MMVSISKIFQHLILYSKHTDRETVRYTVLVQITLLMKFIATP